MNHSFSPHRFHAFLGALARQNPCSQSEGATSTMRASSASRAATTHQTPAGLQNVAKPLLLRPSATARPCAPAAAVAAGHRGARLLVGRSRLLAWPSCSASRKETQVRVLFGGCLRHCPWAGPRQGRASSGGVGPGCNAAMHHTGQGRAGQDTVHPRWPQCRMHDPRVVQAAGAHSHC